MNRTTLKTTLVLLLSLGATAAARATGPCRPDAVPAGTSCLDRYEASVWRVPVPNALLVRKIELGIATSFDLAAGGATRLGMGSDDYAPCTDDGQNCAADIYAVSLPSEFPSAHITWFQAQEACASSGKRLPTSSEWQVGANGTPDPGPDNGTTDCNSTAGSVTLTGARSGCVSARGAFDMAGNLDEWVADWAPLSTVCAGWGNLSDDLMCFSGASSTAASPGALLRGGDFRNRTSAGPLAVVASGGPFNSARFVGFRCAAENPAPLPAEVDNGFRVSRIGSVAVLRWNVASGSTSSGVLRGHVNRLPVGSVESGERCLVADSEADTLTDPELPASGDAFWYLIRGENVLGAGPYGFEGLHGVPAAPRLSATCP